MNTATDCSAHDLRIIASLTPFETEELIGERFKNGNMLGGAHPLASTLPQLEGDQSTVS